MKRTILLTAAALGCAGPAGAGPVLQSLEREISEIVDRAAPAVVSVRTEPIPCHPFALIPEEEMPSWVKEVLQSRLAAPKRSTGTGFFIDPAGEILTTEDVIRGARDVEVVTGEGTVLPARVVGGDRDFNIALLAVDGPGPYPCLELGDSDRLRPGCWALTVGNPFGLTGSPAWGIVSGLKRSGLGTALYEELIQVTAPVNPGDSGGPLLDSGGKAVGVVTATLAGYREMELDWPFLRRYHDSLPGASPESFLRTSQAQGIGFAIPINLAREVLERIRQGPREGRGWLGIRLIDGPAGVEIADVIEGSPAGRAGLRPGDRLVSFQGRPVSTSLELKKELICSRVGEEVSGQVVRGEAPVAFRVRLAAPAPDREAR
ncbi:MAG TPA: trypsin-like peptidase domain-containing protein [bacterium]|nr:trypsin-like peptidase domain-containing protein [bacterium]